MVFLWLTLNIISTKTQYNTLVFLFLTSIIYLIGRDSCLTHKRQSCNYIEASQLICIANHLTGFYMMVTLAFNELIIVAKVHF